MKRLLFISFFFFLTLAASAHIEQPWEDLCPFEKRTCRRIDENCFCMRRWFSFPEVCRVCDKRIRDGKKLVCIINSNRTWEFFWGCWIDFDLFDYSYRD